MLYKIKNHEGYIKIGVVEDKGFQGRMNSYKSHGAIIEVLDTCFGNITHERKIHKLLKNRGLHLFFEWFKDDPYLHKIWTIFKEERYKKIYIKKVKTEKLRTFTTETGDWSEYKETIYTERQF